MIEEFRARVTHALTVLRKHPVLNEVARIAIESIPTAGKTLLRLYDAGADTDETKLDQLQQALERFLLLEEAQLRRHADEIPSHRRSIREALRRETESMREIHGSLLRLLSNNRELASVVPLVKDLYDHLSMWVAKYESLREDPDMCLVFVGPKQLKGFPTGVEGASPRPWRS